MTFMMQFKKIIMFFLNTSDTFFAHQWLWQDNIDILINNKDPKLFCIFRKVVAG